MNKKISTLLAGVALLGAMTANAAPGDAVQSLTLGKNAGLYQLATAGGDVLSINASGKLVMVPAPTTSTGLANTLWCVEVATQYQGQAPKFDFVNKAADMRLDVTTADFSETDSVLVGGEVAGWAFSQAYASNLEPNKPLYSYFTKDTVVGLVVTGQMVTLKKALATEVAIAAAGFTGFTLKTSNTVTLTAKDLNTKFGVLGVQAADKGVKLKFTPDTLGTSLENPFSSKAFIARDTVGDYLTVTRDGNYLRVDTTFTNDKGARFLAYKWTTNAERNVSTIQGNYNFKFTYSPSNDSLTVQVQTARFDNGRVKTDAYVSLQDLIVDEARILTVDTLAQNTLISLDYKGCSVASNRISIASDLYVITNGAGKYLSVPLYGDSAVQWVTLDKNMDPWHMPAYQWVVEKTRTSNEMKETSPIKITNREFSYEIASSLQLYNDGTSTLNGAEVNAANFTKDSLNVKANPYLGYRFLDKDSMTVTTYKLRYLHEFASDKYMGISSNEKDSVLYVGAKSSFVFKGQDDKGVNYGYTTTAVKDLAQLVRKTYTLNLKSTGKMVVADVENRYAVSASNAAAVFYVKENNHKTGSHYFALIDTVSYKALAPDGLRKVGVDDNNLYLKSQNMTETRTSAFSVEIDDAPLYRRFNNVALGETDGPDSLRFYETRRNEYLMDENNPKWQDENKVVNYLGIWSADKATGLSFRIDTAWVGRGLGYIKPQYLISVDRREVAGEDSIPCTYTHNHYDNEGNPVDNKHCSHATIGTPDYTVAKYLVSFQDSVNKVDGRDLPYTDVKNGYTRVGFVKAIHQGDTLYVLANGFEKLAYNKLSVAEIVKSYRAAGVYNQFVRPLTEDTHKNYTWSFRYTNPEAAATVAKEGVANEFLIESMAHNEGTVDAPVYKSIAPEKAAWIKMQNGCVVLTDDKSLFNNAKTGGDGALVFNVKNEANDNLATDNETITTGEVSVIAAQGQVTIANAEGKKVIISNILGQVVANTVISSSNATIAVPAGVVVVAVEGEAAVKAIVK